MATADTERLMRLATYASVAVAGVLIVTKLGAWLYSDSVALLASLIDSTLDAFASLLNLLAVRHALVPADSDHRFGHGKAEALAGLGQSAFVFGSALFLGFEAIHRLIQPQPLEGGPIALGVMGISIALTLALVLFQRHVVARTRSVAITADRLHYLGDLLSNMVVILALVGAWLGGPLWLDPLGGLAVALIILKGAVDILRHSFNQLMDRELADGEQDDIRKTVLAQPDVRGMHDLRTRRSGTHIFIQFHLELDPDITLRAAHRIAVDVLNVLKLRYPDADIIIHEDPGPDQIVPDSVVSGTQRSDDTKHSPS